MDEYKKIIYEYLTAVENYYNSGFRAYGDLKSYPMMQEFSLSYNHLRDQKNVFVIGAPGSGKTTILDRIALEALSQVNIIPIFVPLRNLVSNLPDLITTCLKRYYKHISFEHIALALNHDYKLWLLLDGYDEIAALMRVSFFAELKYLIKNYNNISAIITSRFQPDLDEVDESFLYIKLQSLTYQQIFNRIDENNITIDRDKLIQRRDLISLLSRPLFLESFLQVFSKNINQYDYFAKNIGQYIVWRGHSKSQLPIMISPDKIEVVLSEMGYYLVVNQKEWMMHEEFLNIIQHNSNKISNYHLLIDAVIATEPIQSDENRYRFRHKRYKINYCIKKLNVQNAEPNQLNENLELLLDTEEASAIIEEMYSNYDMNIFWGKLYDKNISKISQMSPHIYSKIKYINIKYPHQQDTIISFLEKINEDLESQDRRRKDILVFAVHGFNTRGEWKNELSLILNLETDGERFLYQPWDYGNFRLGILNPFARKKQLKKFQKFYNDVLSGFLIKPEIVFVAHSFGTYIIGNSMKKYPEIYADRILLLGSVLKRYFPWAKMNNKFSKILNIITGEDFALCISKYIPGLGDAGRYGFSEKIENIIEVCEKYSDHSDIFGKEYMKSMWIPFIRDGSIAKIPPNRNMPKHLLNNSRV